MEKVDYISPEDFNALQKSKANAAYVRVLADKADAERRAADAEARCTVLQIYVKYQLSTSDSIDNVDGKIIRTVADTAESIQQEKKE